MDFEQKQDVLQELAGTQAKQVGELLMQVIELTKQRDKLTAELDWYKCYMEHVPRQTLAQERIAAALERIAQESTNA